MDVYLEVTNLLMKYMYNKILRNILYDGQYTCLHGLHAMELEYMFT